MSQRTFFLSFMIDASFGGCTVPVVEKVDLEIHQRGCVILGVLRVLYVTILECATYWYCGGTKTLFSLTTDTVSQSRFDTILIVGEDCLKSGARLSALKQKTCGNYAQRYNTCTYCVTPAVVIYMVHF